MQSERMDAMILSTHDTFYKGWVDPRHDKEGTFAVMIDQDYHPYIEVGKIIPIKDILVPHKVI